MAVSSLIVDFFNEGRKQPLLMGFFLLEQIQLIISRGTKLNYTNENAGEKQTARTMSNAKFGHQ